MKITTKDKFVIYFLILGCILFTISLAVFFLSTRSTENSDMEIEKKYLVSYDKIPYDLSKIPFYEIEQTYINYSPEIRVRKIGYNGSTFYTMAIKRYVNDEALVREETEFSITEDEYSSTVVRGLDNTILKNRYQIKDNDGKTLAIDVFKGDLEGLVYLEIEFDSEDTAEKYEMPDWVIKDVTNDKRYKNGYLARYGIPTD